jgi:hypothetical protein
VVKDKATEISRFIFGHGSDYPFVKVLIGRQVLRPTEEPWFACFGILNKCKLNALNINFEFSVFLTDLFICRKVKN